MAMVFVVDLFEFHFETPHLLNGPLQFITFFQCPCFLQEKHVSLDEGFPLVDWPLLMVNLPFFLVGLSLVLIHRLFYSWEMWWVIFVVWHSPLHKHFTHCLFFQVHINLHNFIKSLNSRFVNGGRRSFSISSFLNNWYSFSKEWNNNKERRSSRIVTTFDQSIVLLTSFK